MKTIILIFLLIACNSDSAPQGTDIDPVVDETNWSANATCRHRALIAAVMFEESGFVTRIIYGKMPNGDYHVQAQALIDGVWQWLSVSYFRVYVDDSQDEFEPTKKYSVDEVYENCVGGVWY